MKILFYPFNCEPFHGNTLEEKPLGGIERGVTYLSRALEALGHEVYVVTPIISPPPTKPRYLSVGEAWNLKNVDLMIGVRSWKALWQFKAKRKLLWIHEDDKNAHTIGIGDPRVMALFNELLCVSEWQINTLCGSSGYPQNRAQLLPAGVDLSVYSGHEERRRKRLLYEGPASQGLKFMSPIFLELKKRHPDLELHVHVDEMSQAVDLIRQLPNCTVQGPMLHQQYAQELMKAAILVSPTSYEDASCVKVMEAQAAGVCAVTSALGALPEVVAEAGIVIHDQPGTAVYINAFIAALDNILTDDSLFQMLSRKALEQSKLRDWKLRALQLEKYAL